MSNVPNIPSFPPWGAGQALSPTTYSNGVQMTFSPWDLTMEFMHLVVIQTLAQAAEAGQPPQIDPQVITQASQRVVMSPQHAKAFSRVLAANLQNYEQQFGEIPDIQVEGMPS